MLRRQFLKQAGGAMAMAATASISAMAAPAKSWLAFNQPASKRISDTMTDQAFTIRFDSDLKKDLRQRLAQTRWSDAVTTDWLYGMNESFIRTLVQHWNVDYDFDAAEKRLNTLPLFRANIGGFGISYIHLKGRGTNPKPLLLMNGWPSSFVEYGKLAPMLANPLTFGGTADDAFDLVIPALPGFGYSDRPTRPYQVNAEDLFHTLMTEHLGYTRYLAAGTDIGAGVATRLALKHPDSVMGIHISTVVDPPLTATSAPLSDGEKAYLASASRWEAEEGAYEHLQMTRPQTLAFALADSPTGLASWIVEKYYFWSDHGQDLLQTFPLDMLIDNLMIYWATGTIGSSMRYYYDSRHFRPKLQAGDHVSVPTAICMWPKDLVTAPKSWAERFYNVQQYSLQKIGGHFPGWEAPAEYAADVRQFARHLRNL
ncbi:epoxide hydrolase family protein [Dyella soli]|uniref:Epoxide hydrolase n=1 Tax=Dyella soli TaxID=522319 RepID=A0A4R0YMP2_9GAMM|nr:epoxide hydrolase family protein [Dyella soli]TCI10159.1 epoxide hydrolase [Dyella soli]